MFIRMPFLSWATPSSSANVLLFLFYSFESFSYQRKLMVFHWILSDSKSPQVFMTHLNILADLNNAVVSKSSSPIANPLVTLLSAPITAGITVTFMFHSFFQFSCKVSVFISLFAFLQWSAGAAKSNIR